MNLVDIKVVGGVDLHPNILVDGELLKTKKNKFGNIETTYQTEKEEVELRVCRFLELNSKLWFLMSMVFFLISLFGIFNPPYEKKCIVIDYVAKVKLQEKNEIKIKLNTANPDGKAVEIESNAELNEITNTFSIDKTAKKRKLIIKLIEVAVWIVLIVIGIIVVSNKI